MELGWGWKGLAGLPDGWVGLWAVGVERGGFKAVQVATLLGGCIFEWVGRG